MDSGCHKIIFKQFIMQEEKYAIRLWAIDDRPREKLRDKGPAALSNSELLAILINGGDQGTFRPGPGKRSTTKGQGQSPGTGQAFR